MLVLIAILAGCTQTGVRDDVRPTPVDTDTTAPVDSATDTGGEGVDTAGPTERPPTIDCSVLPPVPVPVQTTSGWPAAEDFDLDGDGYYVGVNFGNLLARNRLGEDKLLASSVATTGTGTRILPSGDWVVNDTSNGSLRLIDVMTGAKSTVASGLSYPNGLEVGRDGFAFVAEQAAGRLTQVDPYTGERWTAASGLDTPNGVILSPDEQTLYTVSFLGGVLYAVDRLGPTDWDTPRVLVENWPAWVHGSFDGINVDVCGNIYLTDYGPGAVVRVTPDGQQVDLVADPPSDWIPNMRWGHGIGGWDTSTLYVISMGTGDMYELDMGIEGKKHVLVP